MRFWFSRTADVPIREQIITQVILGIAAGDLPEGSKLPSVRELGRRYNLHPNTVSAAYRELARQRWIESKSGSGVYVRASTPQAKLNANANIDRMIADLFHTARTLGLSFSDVRARLQQWTPIEPPNRYLVIEPDAELRAIVIFELQKATKLAVEGASPTDRRLPELLLHSIPVCMPSKAELVTPLLPSGSELLVLKVRSVPTSLLPWVGIRRDAVISIASRWTQFLNSARTMLVAAGFAPESLVLCDAKSRGWQRSLKASDAVVCDTQTASTIRHKRVITFPLIGEESLKDLHDFERFLQPLQ